MMNREFEHLWGAGAIRAFISHSSEDRQLARDVKTCLERWSIASFVAHDDIGPRREWEDEILQALSSMDLLVTLLTTSFKESNWTDHEVGFAFGRGVPVLSVRLGRDPYGFMVKYQAVTAAYDAAQVASAVFSDVLGDDDLAEPAVDVYLEALRISESFNRSNQLAEYLPRILVLSADQERALVDAFNMNTQVRGAWEVQQGIVELLLRATGNTYAITERLELRRVADR